jgi:hypothetical protein
MENVSDVLKYPQFKYPTKVSACLYTLSVTFYNQLVISVPASNLSMALSVLSYIQ